MRASVFSILLILALQASAQDFAVTAPYSSPTRTTCGAGNDCALGNTEEHSYQVFLPTAGDWTFSLCSSSYDTYLYLGTGLCTNDVGQNDDDCGVQSSITANLASGTYYVTIEGWSFDPCGEYILEISGGLSSNPEDVCSGALSIDCGDVVFGSTVGYSADSAPTCVTTDGTGGGLWYSFIGNGNTITASLCGSSYDTRLRVFSGSCSSLVCQAGNDDDCGLQSEVSWASIAGVSYYILVHGFSSSEGSFTLSLNCGTSPPGLNENQDCQQATGICSSASFSGNSNGNGDTEELDFSNSGCLSIEHESSWYQFTAQTSGTITLTLSPQNGTDDYDFAIWGPNPTCPPSGIPARCSYAATGGDTGMSSGAGDNSEDPFGDRWVEQLIVTAGQEYIMVLDNYSVTTSPFDFAWGGTAILDCSALPVTWLHLDGIHKDGANILEWSTASEINNDYFSIERSVNGFDFEEIHRMDGAGNSSQMLDYRYTDYHVSTEMTYYRLKQVDYDGGHSYTAIIAVQAFDSSSEIHIYPNPMGDELNLDLGKREGGVVSIYDETGRVLLFEELNERLSTLDVHNLDSGIYQLRWTDGFTSAREILIKP